MENWILQGINLDSDKIVFNLDEYLCYKKIILWPVNTNKHWHFSDKSCIGTTGFIWRGMGESHKPNDYRGLVAHGTIKAAVSIEHARVHQNPMYQNLYRELQGYINEFVKNQLNISSGVGKGVYALFIELDEVLPNTLIEKATVTREMIQAMKNIGKHSLWTTPIEKGMQTPKATAFELESKQYAILRKTFLQARGKINNTSSTSHKRKEIERATQMETLPVEQGKEKKLKKESQKQAPNSPPLYQTNTSSSVNSQTSKPTHGIQPEAHNPIAEQNVSNQTASDEREQCFAPQTSPEDAINNNWAIALTSYKNKNEPALKNNNSHSSKKTKSMSNFQRKELSGKDKVSIGRWGEKYVYGFLERKYIEKYHGKSEETENGFKIKGRHKSGDIATVEVHWFNKGLPENEDGSVGKGYDLEINKVFRKKNGQVREKSRQVEIKSTKLANANTAYFTRREWRTMLTNQSGYRVVRVRNAGEMSNHPAVPIKFGVKNILPEQVLKLFTELAILDEDKIQDLGIKL